jgi:hypothetical protein
LETLFQIKRWTSQIPVAGTSDADPGCDEAAYGRPDPANDRSPAMGPGWRPP